MTRARGSHPLKLVAVLWLVQVTSVAFPVYGASVINTYMIADLGLSRGALGTISGLFLWLSGFPAPLVALLMQKKGIRRTMLLGATGLTIGTTLLATVVSSGLQYGLIFCSVVAFGTISCGPIAAQTTVARWSGRHRGRAIAFLLTGPTVGGFIAPLLLNAVIDGSGGNWRLGWVLVAALSAVSLLLITVYIRDAPVSEPAEAVGAERHPQGDLPTWSLGEVLRMPKFWLIWTCPMGVMAGFAFYLAHGALHVQSLEYSLTTGAATLSTMLVFILIANGLLAVINGRITPRFVVAGGCGLFGIGLLLAINATGGPFLFPAMLGLGFGLALTTLNTMLVDYFGLKAYAVLVAIMLAGQTAAGAIADYTAGAVHDASGTYGGVFLTLGVLSCVGAAIWPFLAPNEPAATAQPVAATQKEET